jgi:hypothetical protein
VHHFARALGIGTPKTIEAAVRWGPERGNVVHFGIAAGEGEDRRKLYFERDGGNLSREELAFLLRQTDAPQALAKDGIKVLGVEWTARGRAFKLYRNLEPGEARGRFGSGRLTAFLDSQNVRLDDRKLLAYQRFDERGRLVEEALQALLGMSRSVDRVVRRFTRACGASPRIPAAVMCHAIAERAHPGRPARHVYFKALGPRR